MATTLNSELLAGMLKEKRGNKGLREISKETGGISPATLSRIEQGKIPDVDTFIKLCGWLETPTDTFIVDKRNFDLKSNKDQIVAHLRADRELGINTINMLVQMIDMAYSK
ncbi:MAG: helix-turn-helix transcriptional regulator [Bacteroidia bacterium]